MPATMSRSAHDEASIYNAISAALLAGRLAPGAKLGEQKLADIFGVNRERMRKVLHRLGHERLIEVIPNRGAFVAAPSLVEAREIYEARRIVEAGIVWGFAHSLSGLQLERLQQHLALERAAEVAHDRAESIRLSGAFHKLLGEMTDNQYVVRQVQELVSRTAMLVAFFEPEQSSRCGCEEHASIIEAIARGDAPAAARAMVTHLSLIETRLKPRGGQVAAPDLEEVFIEIAPKAARPRRSRKPAAG
jgi:DNA-binding GntR family transcriptional regulator